MGLEWGAKSLARFAQQLVDNPNSWLSRGEFSSGFHSVGYKNEVRYQCAVYATNRLGLL